MTRVGWRETQRAGSRVSPAGVMQPSQTSGRLSTMRPSQAPGGLSTVQPSPTVRSAVLSSGTIEVGRDFRQLFPLVSIHTAFRVSAIFLSVVRADTGTQF